MTGDKTSDYLADISEMIGIRIHPNATTLAAAERAITHGYTPGEAAQAIGHGGGISTGIAIYRLQNLPGKAQTSSTRTIEPPAHQCGTCLGGNRITIDRTSNGTPMRWECGDCSMPWPVITDRHRRQLANRRGIENGMTDDWTPQPAVRGDALSSLLDELALRHKL